MLRPWGLRAYFLARMPLALVAGLRLRQLSPDRCTVTVPYGWRTTNPFGSMYFAAQAMAAELSTGALALLAARSIDARVSTLITGLESSFEAKADRRATFTCEQGRRLFDAVRAAAGSDEPVTAAVDTTGRLDDGTVVSHFTFTWSLKRR